MGIALVGQEGTLRHDGPGETGNLGLGCCWGAEGCRPAGQVYVGGELRSGQGNQVNALVANGAQEGKGVHYCQGAVGDVGVGHSRSYLAAGGLNAGQLGR